MAQLNQYFDVSLKDINKVVNAKPFFGEYITKSLDLTLEEYRLDSAFNSFQPKFLLSHYNKEMRKYGIRTTENSYFINAVHHNEKLEDALTIAADVSALFVLENKILFSKSIVDEAMQVIKRQDQYIYDGYILGFGYFLKRICFNGPYAISAIKKWVQINLDDIISTLNINIGKIEIIETPAHFSRRVGGLNFAFEIEPGYNAMIRNLRVTASENNDFSIDGSSIFINLLDANLKVDLVNLLNMINMQKATKNVGFSLRR